MGKPSIFSRQYEKKMRNRKKRIAIVGIFFFGMLLMIGMSFFMKGNIKSSWDRNFNKATGMISKLMSKSSTDQKETTTGNLGNSIEKDPDTAQEGIIQKEYTLKLENGQEIKTVYEIKENEAKFKHITPLESGIFYDISPSGKAIVVFDEKAQSIWIVDINGKQSNIAPSEYIGSDGTVYSKEVELKRNSAYIWCNSPKFIDEENVAYFSQLPWFNKESERYVWSVNSKTKVHKYIAALSGTNMKFENVTEKGLKIVINDKIKYLKNTGEIEE